MTASDTEKLRYRLDKDTYEGIEYTLIPASDRWNSLADFTRESIQSQVKPLIRVASGGREANKLIRLLSDVRGINEKQQEIPVKPRIEGRDLEKSTSVTLSLEDFNQVKTLADEMAGKPATATGYCIFKQLSELAIKTDHFDTALERRLTQTWAELNNSLIEPKIHLYQILTKRFRIQDTTEYFIQQDPRPFEEFADVYRDSFYQSDSYEFLDETFGRRTINDVENMIEEHTAITFSNSNDQYSDDSGIRIFSDNGGEE